MQFLPLISLFIDMRMDMLLLSWRAAWHHIPFQPQWRMPAALAGGLYFGVAVLLHVFKKPDSRNELIALVSDLYIFFMMLAYCTHVLIF